MNVNKNALKLVGVFCAGVLVGGVPAYLMTRKAYRQWAESEIAQVKEHYRILRKEDYPSPEDIVAAKERVDELLGEHGYTEITIHNEPEEEPVADEPSLTEEDYEAIGEAVARNIFDQAVTLTEEQEAQGTPADHVTVRDPDNPYVITIDEFMEEDLKFEKITLNYFEEDDTLIDDSEKIITDIEGTVGSKNLEKFGVGSNDKFIVYIRNEKLRADFEVAREEGSYATLVLGLDPETVGEREPKSRPQKMRHNDE